MSPPTVRTDGSGRAEARPQLARVEARAKGAADVASDAGAIAADRTATLRDSVTAVPADRIRTTDRQIKDAEEAFESFGDSQFQAVVALEIDCVPETARDVVEQVIDAGGTVQGVKFELDGATREQLETEALSAAMAQARQNAETIAAAEDLTVGAVRDVSTTGSDSGMDDIVDEALAVTDKTNLEPTPIAVTRSVTVEYELSETGATDYT